MGTPRSRSASMVIKSILLQDKAASLPRSTTESRPLSRNAQAQARLRARRRAYVESLEAEIKRLQSIVDATALHPSRNSCTSTGGSSPLGAYLSPALSFSSKSEPGSSSCSLDTIQLRSDNERLRRERDAFRVQVDALMGYVSRGCAPPPSFPNSNLTSSSMSGQKLEHPALAPRAAEQQRSPTLDSEMDPEDRQDPFSQSPLIQPNAHTRDETNQLLSFYGSNLAFLRHFDLHTQGAALFTMGDKPIQLPAGSNPFGAL